MHGWIMIGAMICAVGCGDDDADSCVHSWEIFEITGYNQATGMCGGGDEIVEVVKAEGPTHFLVTCSQVFGQKMIAATSCSDLMTCQMRAQMASRDEPFAVSAKSQYGFAMTHDARVTTSVSDCDQVQFSESTVVIDGERAALATATWELSGLAEDGMGFCSTEEARARSTAEPCDELVSIQGRRVISSP